jgi:hydrogenase maturation protein HypF
MRLRLSICGAVQGVGFRPAVHRLATDLGLAGWVNNSPEGVTIEVEGTRATLETFSRRLPAERPAHSFIQSLEATWLDDAGYERFEIRPSSTTGRRTALILPDIATCPDCRREILDPANRRAGYPFTNCTNCGPRFSIIHALPYDRENTSMRKFPMCDRCRAEYGDPANRRFHAQPNACPDCGPQLTWRTVDGKISHSGPVALHSAAAALRAGEIVAVKSIGGFHLMADARDETAVKRLRQRKHREEKPFALLFPDLETLGAECEVSPAEARLLTGPESPIVLLRRRRGTAGIVAESVAPGCPDFGAMLPSNPLHILLMAELGFPVIATSGNLSDEPVCIEEAEALERLGGIADAFLTHDRPIVRQVDDSIARTILGREMILRRARGYAPLPVGNAGAIPPELSILATGGQMKNAVALATGGRIFLSQHIGDLETEPARDAFRRIIRDLSALQNVEPDIIAHDLHPDYTATLYALSEPRKHSPVQHHEAHVWSCLADNALTPPALSVAWDGTGLGSDGTIWGGEFFAMTKSGCRRVASLRPFRLPGGDAAAKEPRRAAVGLLHAWQGGKIFERDDLPLWRHFQTKERTILRTMLERGLNSPWCSSVGRLFDAAGSLAGLRQRTNYEGQTAMTLEFALYGPEIEAVYPLPLTERDGLWQLDWVPMIENLLQDVDAALPAATISAKFHNALAEGIVGVAKRIGENKVLLSGGCFQNRYLLERTVKRLFVENFRPYWHQRIPPNDGGLAVGQAMAAALALRPAP